ncbi:MAG: 50S ribosomal protein L11 methyltransferase, partial [Armatimonadota bacterium]
YASEIISAIMHEIFEGTAITPGTGQFTHHAYIADTNDVSGTERRLRDALEMIPDDVIPPGNLQISADWVEESDWAEAWKDYYHPVRIGRRLVVVPSWRPWPDPHSLVESLPDDLVIRIDPGMAFGTGNHPSTSMCMIALEDYLQPGDRVVDVGCGSGILTITACKLGAESVLAIDNDPVCVKVAADNTIANEVADKCRIRHLDTPAGLDETFDMYVSNINERVIRQHMSDAAEIVRDGGLFIFSGFTKRSEEKVAEEMRKTGLAFVEDYSDGEWRCRVARKSH